MFVSTADFGPFDYLRVPYRTVVPPGPREPFGTLRPSHLPSSAPALYWARDLGRRDHLVHHGRFEVAGCHLAGRLSTGVPPGAVPPAVEWHPAEAVHDPAGRRVAHVWTTERGDVYLPFDPGEVMACLWSERYRTLGPGARTRTAARQAAVRAYYAARPALPRAAQLRLRRRFARTDAGPDFPAWPLENGLHEMYSWVLRLAASVAEGPVPFIAPWPDGATWCLVLTHDVETAQGCADIELLREPERRAGYRSSWNFVPHRYPTPQRTLDELAAEGCEIGVHGLEHDGRDLASARLLHKRLSAIRGAAAAWGATGFRSPATQRRWSLMPLLGFDYDSSYTDTDPYEPQPGGCCSYLPFFIDDLVELPITLPQDHTLFSILGHTDASLWISKAQELRRRGGLVLALSHPDYAHGPALRSWVELLEEFRHDDTKWQPLPREAAAWWRDRAASRVVGGESGWRIEGPAAARGRVVEVAGAEREGAR